MKKKTPAEYTIVCLRVAHTFTSESILYLNSQYS